MSNELEDIILTIDTREQNQMRIIAVKDWFTGHGAIVEHSALKHCDYRLIGEFRGVSVNIGVEAKGWDNFLSDDIAEMKEKLLLATGEYDHVGFFVETQNYSFTPDENNKHGKLNYFIPRLNKNLPAKTLAAFEGFLDTISKHPQIHVRQLRSEAQFPYSLYDLLVYLQSEHSLEILIEKIDSQMRNALGTMEYEKWRKKRYIADYHHSLMQLPGIGLKRADKLLSVYPNFFWLCSASSESLEQVLGQKVGRTLEHFIRCHDLVTPEWLAGHHLDGTDKYKTICGQDCYNPQHCNTLCERHPNNPKNVKQDDEGRLAFDAPAKNPVNASGARVEEQPACNGKVAGSTPASGLKRDFADPKTHAECETPNHFKKWDLQCRKCKTIQTVPIKERKSKCIKCRSNEFDIVPQHSSHIKNGDSIAIMAAIEGYLSGFPEGKTVNKICEHFNIHSGDPDKQLFLRHIKKLAWDEKITSDGHIFKHSSHSMEKHDPVPCKFDDEKNCVASSCVGKTCPLNPNFHHSSHAEGIILSNHNPPIPSADTFKSLSSSQAIPFKDTEKGRASKRPDKYEVAVTHDTIPSHPGKDISKVKHGITPHPSLPGDTSSHPGSFLKSVTPHAKPDDPQRPPINRNQNSEVKQESLCELSSPAETYTMVVKCRACHQVIISEQDDDTGFCHDPECIENRAKSKQRMNLKETMKDFMQDMEQHTLQEIVDHCKGWTPGNVFDKVMGAVKSGYFKKMTEQDGRITWQKVT